MKKTPIELYEMTLSGLNLIKQAISIHDADLKLMVANRRFQKMFNLPDELVKVGAEFHDILTYLSEKGEYGQIDDIPTFVQEKVDLARGFQPHYFERTRANGSLISIEGNPLSQGGWISVYTDITEVKRQEDFIRSHAESLSDELIKRSETLAQTNRQMTATVTALEATKQELTDSQEQLHLINSMTPAHIAYVNAKGIYTHSNGKLHTILPRARPKVVGTKFSETLGGDVWPQVEPRFKSVMQGNPSISELYDEVSGRHIRLAMTPDLDEDGVHGCYILSMDVTDEVSARTALAHARRRELATQLTSGMAHDFANLLTIIMGQQAKLESRAEVGTEIADISATIKSAAKRGAELIESLSLIESQRKFDPVVVQIPMFMENFSQLAHAAVPQSIALSITSNLPDDRLIFDPGFAQDALLNLVLNASEAMDGTGRVTVSVSRAHDHVLQMQVNDEGPGFSPDALKNALAPFYSTKTGKVGRGLGLSAAFDFAKSCGGTLRLNNRAETGASVSLRIPYTPVKTRSAGLVLLVDDDDDVREAVRQQLRQAGHAVIEAVSVSEAKELVHISGLTHVVTDLAIGPIETGLDVAKIVPDNVPILVITGLPRSDALRQAAERDHVVLSKPFHFDAMEDALIKAEMR
jgi:signal transduction histidine kinase